jgi:hypothetical protein
MARPFFAQLLSSSSKSGKSSSKKRAAEARAAYLAGPSGAAGPLDILNKERDPWTVEWQKRREEVVDQYWTNKKSMRKQKKIADKRFRKRVDRTKRDIDRYYRLHELKEGDPRRQKAVSRAAHKFKMQERKMRRGYRDDWKQRFHELQKGRDAEKRQITKSMKKESRMARGIGRSVEW